MNTTTHFERDPDLVSTDIDQHTVILHVTQGRYCELNGTGQLIWHALAQPRTAPDLCNVVQANYAVDAATCQGAVEQFLDQLVAQGMVRAVQAPTP